MSDGSNANIQARAIIAAALMGSPKHDLGDVTWTNESVAEDPKIKALKAAVDIVVKEVVYK